MKKMRHSYGSKSKSRTKYDSSVACTKCGLVRQFIGGVATYFINDTIYYQSPPCDNRLVNENSHESKQEINDNSWFAK